MEKKNVIITGSSSGVGEAIAKRFVESDTYSVFAHGGRNEESFYEDVEEQQRKNKIKNYFRAELTDVLQIQKMFEKLDEYGGVDILINNAGIQRIGTFEHLYDTGAMYKVLETNLFSAIHCTRNVLDHMKQQGRGRIINIASVQGLTTSPSKSAYCMAKHAMIALSECIALENRKYGITSNVVAPGFVDTQQVKRQMQKIKQKYNLTTDEAVIEKLSQGRQQPSVYTSTKTVAQSVYDLIHSGLTGKTIELGGWPVNSRQELDEKLFLP